MKNLNTFINEARIVEPKGKIDIFAAYNTETKAVGVALCRPMTVEDVNIEYKAIEAKAKQQFGLKIEQNWNDFRDDYDIESTSDPSAEYVLFHETGNKSSGYEYDTYWIIVGEPGVMKIEKI